MNVIEETNLMILTDLVDNPLRQFVLLLQPRIRGRVKFKLILITIVFECILFINTTIY